MECGLQFVYKFEYHASYEDQGAERELCSVYVGECDGPFDPNVAELDDLRFFPRAELEARLAGEPEIFTPWFKLEWERLATALRASGGDLTTLAVVDQ